MTLMQKRDHISTVRKRTYNKEKPKCISLIKHSQKNHHKRNLNHTMENGSMITLMGNGHIFL